MCLLVGLSELKLDALERFVSKGDDVGGKVFGDGNEWGV